MSQLDQDTWKRTFSAIQRQARRLVRKRGRLKKARYSDMLAAGMYFWSVLHDRPMKWAADKDHYGRLYRPRRLMSRSQLGRRVSSPRFQELLTMIHHDLAGGVESCGLSYLDGKPLTVGVASRDPDAKRGHVMGGFAKGYKVHICSTSDRRIPLWSVQSLNCGETLAAEALIAHMPMFSSQALVLGDGAYDSQRLYNALALKNAALLARPRGLNLTHMDAWQKGRHPKSKESGPVRTEAMAAWKNLPGPAAWIYRQRIHVEGTLSNLCSFGGGLGPLPPWVRGLPRVRRWVGAKIILYHARFHARHGQTDAQ
jgi:hypothetical protein